MSSPSKTVLLDFSGIRIGGGVQLALNFLEELEADPPTDLSLRYLFPETGNLAVHARHLSPHLRLSCPANPLKRLYFESRPLQAWMKDQGIRVVYTFFGAGVPHPSDVTSIVCVAYPIICYGESPYWKHLGLQKRILKKLLNAARVRRLRSANLIVAETAVMQRRLSSTLQTPESSIIVSPPAVTEFISPRPSRKAGNLNILCLSGLSEHKNLWRLPEIAELLVEHRQGNTARVQFHVTGTFEAWMNTLNPQSRALANRLSQHFVWHGSVHPKDIGKLYQDADLLLSLSDLESFSNNYMEAWRARVPLIVSDRDFAREICKDSAAYAEPHDPRSVADAIAAVAGDEARQSAMIKAGIALLAKLPTRAEKAQQILNIIRTHV
jgi:glycosyltransferase involved in cell wall biosynthesis